MADEARLHEILDIAEQAKAEGDQATFDQAMALYQKEASAPPPAAPEKPQAPQPKISDNPLEVVGGGLDALATLVSGAVAQPVSGLVGMAAAPFIDDPAALIEETQALLTHDPMSETGQRMLQLAGKPFEKLAQGADAAGDFVLDKTGSPLLAAGARTLIEGAPDIAGLKGARAAGAAARGVRRVAGTPEQRLLQGAGVDLKRSDMAGEGRWKDMDRLSEDVLGSSSMDVRQAQQFNRAVLDRADPNGTATAGKVSITADVLQDMKRDTSQAYDALHARRDTPLDTRLDSELNRIVADAAADGIDASDPKMKRVLAQIEQFRNLAAQNGGRVPGVAGQRIRTKLGELRQDKDGFIRRVAKSVQGAMDSAWERAAPMADRTEMQLTRKRFQMNDQIEKAMRGNASGNVSPQKLFSIADKQQNRGAGLHDLASAGRNVLVDGLGNSGTAGRTANIGKMVGLLNKPGELARTLAAIGGGRFLNESPNLGAKAGVLAKQRSPQLVAAGSSGQAMLDAEDRRTREFLAALGL